LHEADEFSHPEGLALSRGRLIVADKDNNRLVCLNADTLTWAFAVGHFGSGPNELMCTPRAAAPQHAPHRSTRHNTRRSTL
jgi:hypothetical protein